MLQGIRVLDLTWVLGGPFASYLLAQLGAEVIKIEPPSGDLSRGFPPYYFDGDSSFFLSINRGKRSIVLDLKQPDARAVFHDLARVSHAVLYGFTPDVPARLGLDFDTLHAINPRLCVGELIGFHDQPPYDATPSFDIIAQAMGGFMSITGEPGGKPVRGGYQVADLTAGLYLALAVTGALLHAQRTGAGKKVQVTLLDCQLALLTWQAQNFFVSGAVPQPSGSRHPMLAPSEAFKCADGKYVVVSATTAAHWRPFCAAIGRPELEHDARFASAQARIENVDALAETLSGTFAARPAAHWLQCLQQARVPVGQVNNVQEALEQPLARVRGMIESLSNPSTGNALSFLGNPMKYGAAPQLDYPPALGNDTRSLLSQICGYDEAKLAQLESSGAIGVHARASE